MDVYEVWSPLHFNFTTALGHCYFKAKHELSFIKSWIYTSLANNTKASAQATWSKTKMFQFNKDMKPGQLKHDLTKHYKDV